MVTAGFDRRQILQAGLLGAGMFVAGCAQSAAPMGKAPASLPPYAGRLGVQLHTVRDRFASDMPGTLAAVADIGYVDVQTAGLFEHDPREMRRVMDDLGLISRSAHVLLPAVEQELARHLEEASILGQRYIIVPWMNLKWRTPDGYRRVADSLNAAGEKAKANGHRIAYHNHDFEFAPLEEGGATGFDILLARTDPALVDLEADLFWMAQAGVDQVGQLARAPERFVSCHIKDRSAAGEMVAVGDGVIDFAAILGHSAAAGLEYFYVEHDRPADSLDNIARSYRALNPA